MAAPTIKLNNGQQFPLLGLGTWQSKPGEVEQAVRDAIDAGYRHIDCAMIYQNEKEIGVAIRDKIADGTVKREDLFIVTKLWNVYHRKEQVVPTCKRSLTNFGLDYVDLYLVHWPVATKEAENFNELLFADSVEDDVDYLETWSGMEECVDLGLARGIGLSNFNSKQIDRVLEHARIKPVVNQVEVHPNLNQRKLIAFCKERDIAVTAYSPLGSPTRPWQKPGDPVVSLDNPKLVAIAEKHGKNTAQIILRYLVELGTSPIPKSANKERIASNINVFDFKLAPEDIAVLDSFDCNGRICAALDMKGMKHYPFEGVEF